MERLRHHRDCRGGFALLEVMFALMLIAVLAALAFPALARATGPAALRVASFEISALMREDRNLAQSTGRSVETFVDTDGGRVVSGASSASVGLPSGATARLVDTPTRTIRFFADGRSSGGEILMSIRNARYVIMVSRDTGAIRVVEP